jgi:Spy/CpxP family protein refolding chaperone
MTMLTRPKAIFYLLAVFLAGGIAGGVIGYHWHQWRPPGPPDHQKMLAYMESFLSRKLDLTRDQSAALRPALEQAASAFVVISDESHCRMDEVIRKLHAQLEPFLTPAQRPKLEALERERLAHFAKTNQPPPPPNSDAGRREPLPK